MKKTLGGDRLRSENKMTVDLPEFGRSSHNVDKIIRTTQAAGTLVPYWCQIGLDGTTFYIDIETKIKTLPTVGPVFGSFKHQIDLFVIPIRLYIAALHNNALGIGLNMSKVFLPKFDTHKKLPEIDTSTNPNAVNIAQVNPSSLLSYIGIKGHGTADNVNNQTRRYPAIFLLAYWDIFKNYYANKQEENAFVITGRDKLWSKIIVENNGGKIEWNSNTTTAPIPVVYKEGSQNYITIEFPEPVSPTAAAETAIATNYPNKSTTVIDWQKLGNTALFKRTDPEAPGLREPARPNAYATKFTYQIMKTVDLAYNLGAIGSRPITLPDSNAIELKQFKLSDIDDMRKKILQAPQTYSFVLPNNAEPYCEAFKNASGKAVQARTMADVKINTCNAWFSQAGLAVKTHLSDRFNNWLSTEWIDGTSTGINDITAVDVSDGKLSMDALILAKKVFNLLNRIAISDGSYLAWREATYGVTGASMPESPIFCGGMQSEIAFDEIVSNSATEEEPLGTLAGRGRDILHKSGSSLKIKCEEPSMIMAIGSITPRVDYSQGNKWWNRLETMDDFHKPSLDAIGFQELVTDEMCASDTYSQDPENKTYHSVGKQPSWIEYMTDTNEAAGDFAAGMPLSFMSIQKIFETDEIGAIINGPTTYIDPQIYNQIFADASLSAMNFWVQAAFNVTARRVMSAKQIPNL